MDKERVLEATEQPLQRTRDVAPQRPFAAELWVRLLKVSNVIKKKQLENRFRVAGTEIVDFHQEVKKELACSNG